MNVLFVWVFESPSVTAIRKSPQKFIEREILPYLSYQPMGEDCKRETLYLFVNIESNQRNVFGFDVIYNWLIKIVVKTPARKKNNKVYQTPYGAASVQRNIYQTSNGGKTYWTDEDNAQIIRGSTPKFAKQISHKYSNMNAPSVCADLQENHQKISHSYTGGLLFANSTYLIHRLPHHSIKAHRNHTDELSPPSFDFKQALIIQ